MGPRVPGVNYVKDGGTTATRLLNVEPPLPPATWRPQMSGMVLGAYLDDLAASCGCTSQTSGGRAAWPPAERSKEAAAGRVQRKKEAAAGRVQRLLSRSCQSVARLGSCLWQTGPTCQRRAVGALCTGRSDIHTDSTEVAASAHARSASPVCKRCPARQSLPMPESSLMV